MGPAGPATTSASSGASGGRASAGRPSGGRRRRGPFAATAVLLLAAVTAAGCVSYTPSVVPRELLDPGTGNGWTFHKKEPPGDPASQDLGLVKRQTFAYRDTGDKGGHPASLSVISFKVAFSSPDLDDLADRARTEVQAAAQGLGVELDGPPREETRATAAGDEARTFVWDGTVTEESDLFTDTQADVKVAGAVWNCKEAPGGNSVVAVALAQVNERSAAGLIQDPDDRNWVELWEDADPGDARRDGGLMMQVTCGG